ncbi:AraC family transcriptional regulator [Spirosoma radiotolerans]|uniref:AraC family transcriptional regulator n=1 Tax=Spirosoma radiotolerans TaxID=1379870 RepID=A0A0E3V6P0_9BACT|nr:AraC family transcriptional regulator [Spirosoma radiotolerans]AKD54706.1 AraC family transcriptional regulator [Spirosoma radiotolerans]
MTRQLTTNDTLSIASINLILFAAQQRGADADSLARAIGVSKEQLRDPDGRVPIRLVQALWREVIAATGDPNISLRLGELINPVAIGVLAYVMMHCPTLGQAFDKLCRYQDIVCEGIRTTGRLVQSATAEKQFMLVLQITSADIIYPQHALNSEFSIYLAVMRALTGHQVEATEIHFAYPRPIDTTEHERVFAPARLTFDAPETAMILNADLIDLPILNASPSLSVVVEKHANDILDKLRTPSLSSRVKSEIIALMKGEEPTLAAVAERLAMGVRTLQLHLKEAGTSYQQLLDDTRKELAIGHLREPKMSTTDIAFLLGFAEPSVFFRSFKKWTGLTPGAYRQAQA